MLGFVAGLAPAASTHFLSITPLNETPPPIHIFSRRSYGQQPLIYSPRCQKQQQRTSSGSRSTRTRTSRESGREKQKTLNFATDIKGHRLWNLRKMGESDFDNVIEMLGEGFPRDSLESLIENTGGNMVVEASLKPSKESERYRSLVTGYALVDVTKWVIDKDKKIEEQDESSLEKKGEFIKIFVDPRMGETDSVKKKLILGSMKMMKDEGVKSVGAYVPKDALPFWLSLGFQQTEEELDPLILDDQTVETLKSLERLEADLLALSPEPQVKIG